MSNTPENHPNSGQSPENNPEEYKVGRGKPPKDRQWKPGQSGNPGGKSKPKPRPNYGDLCNRILLERIRGQGNGKAVSLMRAKAWAKSVVYRGALLGDPAAEDVLLMFEKPWDSAPTKQLEFRLVDSDDDIPPEFQN